MWSWGAVRVRASSTPGPVSWGARGCQGDGGAGTEKGQAGPGGCRGRRLSSSCLQQAPRGLWGGQIRVSIREPTPASVRGWPHAPAWLLPQKAWACAGRPRCGAQRPPCALSGVAFLPLAGSSPPPLRWAFTVTSFVFIATCFYGPHSRGPAASFLNIVGPSACS